jgi:AcrR family transcriptional regulator
MVPVMRNVDRRSGSIEKLLLAALAVLEEGGYARFRVADVSTRSNTSQGLLFRYFPTKNDLVAAALERALGDHLDRLANAFAVLSEKPFTRRDIMESLWEVLNHPELRWTYELYAAAGHDGVLRSAVSPVLEHHSTRIDDVAESFAATTGVLPVKDVHDAVNLVTWSLQGVVLNSLARELEGREVALISYLDALAEAMYGPVV